MAMPQGAIPPSVEPAIPSIPVIGDAGIRSETRNDGVHPAALRVEDRIRLKKLIFADAFQFLKEQITTATPKLTIPSASMVHYGGGRAAIDEKVYPDLEEFWSDLGAAYAGEVQAPGELGCTYLQPDDTSLAYLNDPRQREHIASVEGDVEH